MRVFINLMINHILFSISVQSLTNSSLSLLIIKDDSEDYYLALPY